MIKLGYGTYGMKEVDPFEAVQGLKKIGYDAIEIAATKGWPTAPFTSISRTGSSRPAK